MNRKYYFTQLSAPIVGVGVALLLLAMIGKLGILKTVESEELKFAIISIAFLIIPITMVIWGKILVSLGVLSKSEAKGFPWSKPWKDK